MLNALAMMVVLLVGIYLIALGGAAWWFPERARRFLAGFASSAFTHYMELASRLLAGWALLHHAPEMRFSRLFVLVGWLLVLTTAALVAVPWRLHHRFARWAVPIATGHLRLVALASVLLGSVVVASVILGAGPP